MKLVRRDDGPVRHGLEAAGVSISSVECETHNGVGVNRNERRITVKHVDEF